MNRALILDGYIDEPAAFGVPPYISHYVRYAAGILAMKNYQVTYYTIDQVRTEKLWDELPHFDLILVIGGITVPGNYVGGQPMSHDELEMILGTCKRSIRLIGGPFSSFQARKGGTKAKELQLGADYALSPDIAVDLYNYLFDLQERNNNWKIVRSASVLGASIIKQHPRYPNVICEIELSRGCERKGHCSFCAEPIFYPKFTSRPVEDVIDEICELYKNGCRAFRFGRSANVLAYYFDIDGKPCPTVFEDLYKTIWTRCPQIEVLHHDNANPAFIANYERECAKIVETMVSWNTTGDVLSFGVESFDPRVVKMNNIMNFPQQVLRAVELVNQIGTVRIDGVPKLLPGINLVFGLIGETKQTYEENLKWLKLILDKGLLLRRINLRQVIVEPGTALYRFSQREKLRLNRELFRKYKEKIREQIDLPMIRRVFPVGSILRNVYPEYREGKITFARQLGSYPVLAGVAGEFASKGDVVVVDHGPRSITAVRYPLNLNTASYEELIQIPTIGERRAKKILLARPFKSFEELMKVLENNQECMNVLNKIGAVVS
ncbi:MAG TPA: radical SAM protein [Pseudothermotoga sp.]|nr:radical SAM protein [Pseudothermotoga sp.]HOK83640.1 radical SAM protein [Pseudothermotoga sp.]HPP69279.1 radical SAM protein [Pseudothermotoga sp.]